MSGNLTTKLDEVITESKKVREVSLIAEKARTRLLKLTFAIGVILILILGGVLWIVIEHSASDAEIQRIIDSQIAATECQDEADVRACVEQKLVP